MRILIALCAGILPVAAANAAQINEFAANPPGGDPPDQIVELIGTPGEDFEGYLVWLESDPGGSNPGDVNNFAFVDGTFDANGLLAAPVSDPENPAFTLVLTDEFGGDTSTDIDADDDGTPDDLSAFGTILDAIGVPDDDVNDNLLYGADLGGSDLVFNGVFEPLLVFREATTGDLYNTVTVNFGTPEEAIAVFDAAANEVSAALFTPDPTVDTFGAVNPALVPEPTTVALALLSLAAVAGRKRG